MGRALLATVITGLLLSGCGEKKVEIPEPESRPVKLQVVSVGENETFRTFPAIVEAGDKAVLAFRVSGQIISLDVNPGTNVKRGQKLASLNPDELTLLVEQAQANYELAYVQFKRDEELRKTNVVSELDYDTSKAALNQAQAALSKQKSNLGYATLVAPYDGTLSLSLIENYEYIMAKELLCIFKVQDSSMSPSSYPNICWPATRASLKPRQALYSIRSREKSILRSLKK